MSSSDIQSTTIGNLDVIITILSDSTTQTEQSTEVPNLAHSHRQSLSDPRQTD
jgi:hypothetical protein